MKDINRDILVDSHNILRNCGNYLCHLLNVHDFYYFRQIEMFRAEPLEF